MLFPVLSVNIESNSIASVNCDNNICFVTGSQSQLGFFQKFLISVEDVCNQFESKSPFFTGVTKMLLGLKFDLFLCYAQPGQSVKL